MVQNDSPGLMYDIIFSSLGGGIGQRDTAKSTFCSEAIKSLIWEKEHTRSNTPNIALNVEIVLIAGQQPRAPLFKGGA